MGLDDVAWLHGQHDDSMRRERGLQMRSDARKELVAAVQAGYA